MCCVASGTVGQYVLCGERYGGSVCAVWRGVRWVSLHGVSMYCASVYGVSMYGVSVCGAIDAE